MSGAAAAWHIFQLGIKELLSLCRDPGAAVPDRLHLHVFGLHAVEERGDGRGQRLHRHRQRGQSEASRAVRDAMLPPLFLAAAADRLRATSTAAWTGQVHLRGEHAAAVPVGPRRAMRSRTSRSITDATAMSQAGRGPGYIQQIIDQHDRAVLGARAASRRTQPLISARNPRRASTPTCSRAGSSPSTR